MITRKEVALAANVSEATVSRVFNGVSPMREDTKQRVLLAAKQLNYYPNAIAQSFARRRSGNLGVVLPFVPNVHLFSTQYFSEILSGIGEEVRQHGYDMLISMFTPHKEIDYSKLFLSQKVDACVILGSQDTFEQRASLLELQRLQLPFCLINQHFVDLGFQEVDADHLQGSLFAIHHLVEQGYRRIAFVNGSALYSNSRDRALGYEIAMKQAGLEPLLHLHLEGNYSRKSGYQLAATVWEQRDDIDALLVANDRMAIGLMQGLREIDPHASQRFAIVGCDDSDAARLHNPALTSINVPFFDMGKVATKHILQSLKEPSLRPTLLTQLPTHLIIRESSLQKETQIR